MDFKTRQVAIGRDVVGNLVATDDIFALINSLGDRTVLHPAGIVIQEKSSWYTSKNRTFSNILETLTRNDFMKLSNLVFGTASD